MTKARKFSLPSRSQRPASESKPKEHVTLFGLTRGSALLRRILYWTGFFLLWQLAVIIVYPTEWGDNLRSVLSAVLSQSAGGMTVGSTIFGFVAFILRSSFSFSVLKYIPLFMLPNLLAKFTAARYLTDIFELELENTAWIFLTRAAFASQYHTITISEGTISEADQKSPIILIGGPGYVQINLDSAALFEKANGEPQIVGPTPKKKILHGFERLREVDEGQYAIIDLRDQFIKNLNIDSRSREGIRIKVDGVKVLFSIFRDVAPTPENPYPFSKQAVHSLVYNQVASGGNPKKNSPAMQWIGSMSGMVTGELNDLIASRTLSEILASIGELEVVNETRTLSAINELTRQIAPGVDLPAEIPLPLPNFVSRPKITNRFYDDDFRKRARGRGLELSWIDIGTWEITASIILENHKEAWQISKNNVEQRASLKQQQEEIQTQELVRLIQETVTTRYNNLVSNKSAPFIVRDLLVAYHKQLTAASDRYKSHKQQVPAKLARALAYLDKILEIVPHYVG